MLDPMSLAGVVFVAIGFIMVLIYFFSSKEEGDFEKAFNRDALELLGGMKKDKEKTSTKQMKNQEKKKGGDTKKNEVKKDEEAVVVKEVKKPVAVEKPKPVAPTVEKIEKVVVAPKVAAPVATKKPVVAEKQQKKEEVVASIVVEASNGVVAGPSTTQSPVVAAPAKPSPAPGAQSEKKKNYKAINLRDLDCKKVNQRLAHNESVEPEIVEFLQGYMKDTELQKSNLTSEVKALSKKLAEQTQRTEKAMKDKTSLDNRHKEELNRVATLTQKVAQMTEKEAELRRQLMNLQTTHAHNEATHAKNSVISNDKITNQIEEIRRLKHENATLKIDHKKVQVSENEIERLKARTITAEQQADQYLRDWEGAKREMVKLTGIIGEHKDTIEAVVKEKVDVYKLNEKLMKEKISEKDMQEMNANVELLEASIAEVKRKAADQEAENEKLKKELAELKKASSEVEEVKSKMVEVEASKEKLAGERDGLLAKQQEAIREYASLKAMVDDLNKEINQYVSSKQAQETVIAELRQKEKEFEALKAEHAKIVEIPKNAAPAAPAPAEEVFELKRTNVELASTSNGVEEELKKVLAKNEYLEAKNNELRARNMTILEKAEELQKQQQQQPTHSKAEVKKEEFDVVGERKKVVDKIGVLSKAKLAKVADDKAYAKWLDEVVGGVKKELSAAEHNKPTSNGEVEKLRGALRTLAQEIEKIEEASQRQTAKYEARIAELSK